MASGTRNATERAVYERLFYVKTSGQQHCPYRPASKSCFFRRMAPVRRKLISLLGRNCIPFTKGEFLDTYRGRPAHYNRYVRAAELWQRYGSERKRKAARVKGFIKREKLPYHAKGVENTVLRLISPRDPCHAYVTGRYLKKAEQVYGVLKQVDRIFEENGAVQGERTVLKGLCSIEVGEQVRAKWERIPNAVAVSFDASRFDQHISFTSLLWEHGIYEYMFPRRKFREFWKQLDLQLRNRGKIVADSGDFEMSFSVEGGRMSGDMNTSLGNCLLMSCLTKAYMDSLGVKQYAVGNNGDDTFVILDAKHVGLVQATINDWFREMGFKMEVEKPSYYLEELVFCQGRFLETDRFWHFSREPVIAMTKDSLLTKPMPGRGGVAAHLAAIGECGSAGHACIPVMSAYYRYLSKFRGLAKGEKQLSAARRYIKNPHSGDWVRSKANLTKWYDRVDYSTRISYYLITGVDPAAQVLAEEDFDCAKVDRMRIRCPFERQTHSTYREETLAVDTTEL